MTLLAWSVCSNLKCLSKIHTYNLLPLSRQVSQVGKATQGGKFEEFEEKPHDENGMHDGAWIKEASLRSLEKNTLKTGEWVLLQDIFKILTYSTYYLLHYLHT